MKIVDWIVSKIENYVCVVTCVVMLTLTFANVLSRYGSRITLPSFGFSVSMSFSEEIVTNLFVLASLAGSAVAIRENAHLGLDFVTSYLPMAVRKFLFFFANALGMFFSAVLLYEGTLSAQHQYASGQVSTTMQWPEWIYGATVPIGAGMLLIRFAITFIKAARGNWKGVFGHEPAPTGEEVQA